MTISRTSQNTGTEKVADRIANDIADRILLGTIPPQVHLPPVRRLAEQYRVNVSTIQRVITQLESLGLVDVRRGSGATVRDIQSAGGLDLLPMMISAHSAAPERAGKILADYLEVRRILSIHVLESLLARKEYLCIDPIKSAVKELDENVKADPADLQAIACSDGRVNRSVLDQMDQSAMIGILNLLERTVLGNEALLQAFYGSPEHTQALWHLVLDAFESPNPMEQMLPAIENELETKDEEIVRTFVQQLKRKNGEGRQPHS